MQKAFKQLLHRYKVEAFKISHQHQDQVQETAREILAFTESTLNNAYHYHFHGDQDPRRIETFKLVKSYTLEALLPPVVEKIMWRVTALEKQHQELVRLVGDILETLTDDKFKMGTG